MVLDSPDYLEYLRDDPETSIIGMYIEGVRDGRRLFRRLEAHTSFRAFLLDMLMSHKRRTRKPFLTVVTPSYVPEAEEELKRVLLAEGIPSFPTFQRAAKALRSSIEYQRFFAESLP